MELFGRDKFFYHGSLRRYVALFGSLFTDVYIRRASDAKEEYIKVPIRYGNGNMYLKAPQDGSREVKQVSRILPAMSFELDNVYKDVSRKTHPLNRVQHPTHFTDTIISTPENYDVTKRNFQLNRIPYNFIFKLVIRTKNTDDMLQIVEQIVPAFDGNLSVTIQDTTGVPVEQDITVILDEISPHDNYEEEMQSRLIEWTLTFEMKGYLYKRTQQGLVIKEVELYSGETFDTMTLIETTNEQGEIHEEQLNLAKATEVVEEMQQMAPVKKITRKTRKKAT